MKKKYLHVCILAFLTITSNLSATTLNSSAMDKIKEVSAGANGSVQAISGGWMITLMAWIPIILFFSAFVGVYIHKKKKVEQSDGDHLSIVMWAVVAAIGGGIGGIVVNMFLSIALTGDYTNGATIYFNYWQSALLGQSKF